MKLPVLSRLGDTLTGRRGARRWLALSLLVIVLLFGALSGSDAPPRASGAPVEGSDSARVAQLLRENTTEHRTTALLVASGDDAQQLDPFQVERFTAQSRDYAQALGLSSGRVIRSEDRAAVMVPLSWDTVSEMDDRQTLTDLRSSIAAHPIDGVQQQVTGSTAFAVDITGAFAGADFTLLAVTVAIVAILLIVTYRSPILWLLPLLVVGLADGLAGRVANLLGTSLGLHFDAGVLSVLVFGAGTNYALLLISRYRDELRHQKDHRAALRTAWVASFEAIATSNLTVVLALLTLGLAVMDDTRGLGVVCAAGLLIAALLVLFLLPPVLALAGRKAFWPLVPRPGVAPASTNVFGRAAHAAMRKPALNAATLIVLLLVLAGGLAGTRMGLDQTQQFRTQTESASAMQQLVAHFPAGEAQPITVLSDGADTTALRESFAGLADVARVAEPSTLNSTWQQFSVITHADPGSQQAQELIKELRDQAAAHSNATVLIGGQIAEQYDNHQGHLRDLFLIAPVIAAICLLMLGWLTRSWRTAVALGFVNLLSAAAALGVGSVVSALLFRINALDIQVPLLAFVFLVALGVDYTIFLTQRVRQDLLELPLHAAVPRAASRTGTVITSAGMVLAGVFAALATLPLTVLGQLGVIVGLGVLVDTFLVRTLLLPALFALLSSGRHPLFGDQPSTSTQPAHPAAKESEIHA
ncbi:MMPL family transporter [Glutamicibacter sp. PS]|uniref:MMPL family transporter n=1 Tax=Glutamicibacter sp. PS TaxID=3075634 RepID=UPI0028509D07|nr:MMPL family transporter [Glutamicibacter sp. PS]MDR4532621.1 MMPL family transporter [Glutamicibacter sp. PS]